MRAAVWALGFLAGILLWQLLLARYAVTFARAERQLEQERAARLAHEKAELQLRLDAALWSRDQALLDNAALRGEYGIEADDRGDCGHRCGCTSDMECPHYECGCGGEGDDVDPTDEEQGGLPAAWARSYALIAANPALSDGWD